MFTVLYPGDRSFIPDFLPELMPAVMEGLDGDDFTRLRQVNRLAEKYVAATIHARTRALLRDTPRDYDALIQALDSARAVIGGLGAVYILFPTAVLPAYFHVYVPRDAFRELAKHLTRRQRFVGTPKIPNAAAGEAFPEGVEAITRFQKGPIAIDLIQSWKRSPLYPIASQLHTGYFNYVSTRSYGSAYPSLTRQHRALLTPARLIEYVDIPAAYVEECKVWQDEGWVVQVEWEPWAPGGQCTGTRSVGCAAAVRAFGDRWSFSGSYAAISERDQKPRSVVEDLTVVWWRGGHTCGPACHSGQPDLTPGSRMCLRRII